MQLSSLSCIMCAHINMSRGRVRESLKHMDSAYDKERENRHEICNLSPSFSPPKKESETVQANMTGLRDREPNKTKQTVHGSRLWPGICVRMPNECNGRYECIMDHLVNVCFVQMQHRSTFPSCTMGGKEAGKGSKTGGLDQQISYQCTSASILWVPRTHSKYAYAIYPQNPWNISSLRSHIPKLQVHFVDWIYLHCGSELQYSDVQVLCVLIKQVNPAANGVSEKKNLLKRENRISKPPGLPAVHCHHQWDHVSRYMREMFVREEGISLWSSLLTADAFLPTAAAAASRWWINCLPPPAFGNTYPLSWYHLISHAACSASRFKKNIHRPILLRRRRRLMQLKWGWSLLPSCSQILVHSSRISICKWIFIHFSSTHTERRSFHRNVHMRYRHRQ